MQNIQQLVQTWMVSGRQEEVNEVTSRTRYRQSGIVFAGFTHISGISTGHATFLDVVKALGDYLTDDEDVIRAKGSLLLRSVDLIAYLLSLRC